MRLLATAPVLAAPDVGATASWYAEHLGFRPDLFPRTPPHSFAILNRDGVEIMLRRCRPAGRTENDWDVYVRMEGVDAFHQSLLGRTPIVEALTTKDYACREFAVEDPNGFRLVFSESVER